MYIAYIAYVSYIHLFISAIYDNGHSDTPIDRYNEVKCLKLCIMGFC
jgi:hypothetical protein